MKNGQALATTQAETAIYESLALRGDLSALGPKEKAAYYKQLCDRLGLDPATQPFIPLKLNGKEILYASRGATDQLARLHAVNRTITDERTINDCYIVTVEASLPNGRREQAKGAVSIVNLKGEGFANAIMKAETKAKRRATLSILGLGLLDESELDTIPARAFDVPPAPAIERQAPPPVIEAPHADLSRLETLKPLVTALNKAGDSIKWTPSALLEYAAVLFETELDSIESLTDEEFQTLGLDLAERLKGLGDGQG